MPVSFNYTSPDTVVSVTHLQGGLEEVLPQSRQGIQEREVGVGAESEGGELVQDIQHPLVLHEHVVDGLWEDGALELVEQLLHAHVNAVHGLDCLHCTRED